MLRGLVKKIENAAARFQYCSGKMFFYQDAQCYCLHHNGHPYVPQISKKLYSPEISDKSAFILQQLCIMGVKKSKLSKLLNSIEENDGMFNVKTILLIP